MKELVKQMGFESIEEFHKLNASADLSDPKKLKIYLDWRENDGTKEGLLKVIAAQVLFLLYLMFNYSIYERKISTNFKKYKLIMDEKALKRIIEYIRHRGMPPTLVYAIDERIFSIIAETAAGNIYEW